MWSSFSRKIRHNPRGTYWFEFFESFHLMYWFEFFETMMYGILGCIGFEMTLFASKHMLELFESIHLSYRYRATSWFKFSNQFIWCLHSNFSNQSVYRIIIVIVLCHLWCPSFVKKFNTTKEPLIDSNFSNQFIWCIHSNFSNHALHKIIIVHVHCHCMKISCRKKLPQLKLRRHLFIRIFRIHLMYSFEFFESCPQEDEATYSFEFFESIHLMYSFDFF